MSAETVEGWRPDQIAAMLTHGRGLAEVMLEPGDGTRYELYIIYRSESPECLLVVRDIGGRPTVANIPSWFNDYDLEPLTNGNEWTRQVLRWYFGLLYAAMGF